MLYRVILSNYKTFAYDTQFDMFPNVKRENFISHVITDAPRPVLKSTAVYGANGSGKSNLVKAVQHIQAFASKFDTTSANSDCIRFYEKNKFRLSHEENHKPIGFLIEFSVGSSMYTYTFDIRRDGISSENLHLSGFESSEDKLLFHRSYGNITFAPDVLAAEGIEQIINRQLKAYPSQSALSIICRLHLIENEHINKAFSWFDKQLSVITPTYQIPNLIEKLSQDHLLLEYINIVIRGIGLGVESLDIHTESFDDWLSHNADEVGSNLTKIFNMTPKGVDKTYIAHMDRQFPALSASEQDGVKMVHELIFKQTGIDGYVGDMECETQSDGTLRLLTLLPTIYDAMYSDNTVVIDEIEKSIHPVLIKRLIKMFGDLHTRGQLVFTTHDTHLLDQQQLLRPDEVWLIEKKDGCSRMYSLNDFKIHRTLSLENGYLDGRFGGIPFIDDLNVPVNGAARP